MRCIIKFLSAITKGYMLRLVQAMARINPPESRTLKQAPCQVLLFAYKSIYTEINSGILIRGLDPSLGVYNFHTKNMIGTHSASAAQVPHTHSGVIHPQNVAKK